MTQPYLPPVDVDFGAPFARAHPDARNGRAPRDPPRRLLAPRRRAPRPAVRPRTRRHEGGGARGPAGDRRRARGPRVSAARRLNPDRPAVVIIAVTFGVLIVGVVLRPAQLRRPDATSRPGAGAPAMAPACSCPIMIDAAVLTLHAVLARPAGPPRVHVAVLVLPRPVHRRDAPGQQPARLAAREAVQRIVGTGRRRPRAARRAPRDPHARPAPHRARPAPRQHPPPTSSPTVIRVVNLADVTQARSPAAGTYAPARRRRAARPTARRSRRRCASSATSTGVPFAEIGTRLKISKSRAHQIYQEAQA